jgi:hypothetical protein
VNYEMGHRWLGSNSARRLAGWAGQGKTPEKLFPSLTGISAAELEAELAKTLKNAWFRKH